MSNMKHFLYQKEVLSIMFIIFHTEYKVGNRTQQIGEQKRGGHGKTTYSLGLGHLLRFFNCPVRESKFTLKTKLPSGTLVFFFLLFSHRSLV